MSILTPLRVLALLTLCCACSQTFAPKPNVLQTWPSGSPQQTETKTSTGKTITFFYPSGTVEVLFPYDAAGQIHGTLYGYYPDGTLAEESHWLHGAIQNGRWLNKDGTLYSQVSDGNGARALLYEGNWSGFEFYLNGQYDRGAH